MTQSRAGPRNERTETVQQHDSGPSKEDRVDRPSRSQHTAAKAQRQAARAGKPRSLSPKVHAHDGRVVGEVVGEVLYKDVKRSEHLLVSPYGWAFDVCSLNEAQHKGAKSVRVRDLESMHIWCVSISDIRRFGMRIDRGEGIQLALVLERFKHYKPEPKKMDGRIDRDEPGPAVQLGMFESPLGFGAMV